MLPHRWMFLLVASAVITAAISRHECSEDEFACRDGSMCIRVYEFCDGYKHCRDGSDEPPYWSRHETYEENITICRGTRGHGESVCLLPTELLPQKERLCSERDSCGRFMVSCEDGSQCISTFDVCDQIINCRDRSDEPRRLNLNELPKNDTAICRPWTGSSKEICILPAHFMPHKSEICHPEWRCVGDTEHDFSCVDGSACLLHTMFCDDDVTCNDGSDEITSPSEAQFEGRMCVQKENPIDKQCMLPSVHICDGWATCAEGIDECLCGEYTNDFLDKNCFRCLSHTSYVIPISKLCDGRFDCPDLTDECLCQERIRPKICHALTARGENSQHRRLQFTCTSTANSTKLLIDSTRVCDNIIDCKHGEDEKGCRGEVGEDENVPDVEVKKKKDHRCWHGERMATSCDGNPECWQFLHEECHLCQNKPEFCNIDLECLKEATLNGSNKVLVTVELMCDGVGHCGNLLDESGCSSRFYCTDEPLPNIPIEKRCDMVEDCVDGKDEKNCTSQFHCNDNGKQKYIPISDVCDGIQDCGDGADECQPGCISSTFSDEHSMITNKAILTFVWIVSLIAVIGCSLVFILTTCKLVNLARRWRCISESGHTIISMLLILNLSFSDLLVGMYTLGICIKAVEFDELYCKVDRDWRSSTACSTLGAMLVIGSEQSVFIIVLLTIQRLRSVLRPFSPPKIARTSIAIACSWVLSLGLGLAPTFPSNSEYFVSSIAYKENRIFKTINYTEKDHLAAWLNIMDMNMTSHNGYSTSWSSLKNGITRIHPNLSVAYEFGYYSSHTVCLPTFFPDPSRDKAWGYSLALLLINFVAFIFMLVANFALYRAATKPKTILLSTAICRRESKRSTRLQQKLTRIVVSDFLCWMPVCILGFLQIGGVNIPKDVYLPIGLLIIPINSALNPTFYSDVPDFLWAKFKRTTASIASSVSTASARIQRSRLQSSNSPNLSRTHE